MVTTPDEVTATLLEYRGVLYRRGVVSLSDDNFDYRVTVDIDAERGRLVRRLEIAEQADGPAMGSRRLQESRLGHVLQVAMARLTFDAAAADWAAQQVPGVSDDDAIPRVLLTGRPRRQVNSITDERLRAVAEAFREAGRVGAAALDEYVVAHLDPTWNVSTRSNARKLKRIATDRGFL